MHNSAIARRLLCIDDDPAFVELLSRKFNRRNITVIHAFDAIQGYRLAVSERPDVIITDYCMPYRFGTQLLRQLQETPELAHVPVIVVSGRDIYGHLCTDDDPSQARLLKDLGAAHVLRKPLKWKTLYDAVDDCMASQRLTAEHLNNTANRSVSRDEHRLPESDVSTKSGKSLLVVEDDRHACHTLKRRLDRSGFHVITAGTGQEALTLADQHHPDAITLDFRLPDMDGFEVAHRLYDDEQTCDIPIIFIAGKVDRRFFELSRIAGGRYFLRKPFDPDLLICAVNDVLKHVEDRCVAAKCLV